MIKNCGGTLSQENLTLRNNLFGGNMTESSSEVCTSIENARPRRESFNLVIFHTHEEQNKCETTHLPNISTAAAIF